MVSLLNILTLNKAKYYGRDSMGQKTYSEDLRERSINLIREGHKQCSVAKLLKISTSTISSWWSRYKEEGHVKPRKRLGAKRKVNLDELRKVVMDDPNKTLAEMGKMFEVSGVTIMKNLKKLKMSYKKKLFTTKRQMK